MERNPVFGGRGRHVKEKKIGVLWCSTYISYLGFVCTTTVVDR